MDRGATLKDIQGTTAKSELAKTRYEAEFDKAYDVVMGKMKDEFGKLGSG
jgi:hypothetical protein